MERAGGGWVAAVCDGKANSLILGPLPQRFYSRKRFIRVGLFDLICHGGALWVAKVKADEGPSANAANSVLPVFPSTFQEVR